MDWPAMSADMSPNEHVCNKLGRRVRNRLPPPANVAQLSQMLIQLRIQNVIQSMYRRCQGEWWSIHTFTILQLLHKRQPMCNISVLGNLSVQPDEF